MSFLKDYDENLSKITDTRGAVYGHPLDDFGTVVALAQALGLPNGQGIPPEVAHGLYMICVKLARFRQSPQHLDSLVDIAGYARTIAMVIDEAGKRAKKGGQGTISAESAAMQQAMLQAQTNAWPSQGAF